MEQVKAEPVALKSCPTPWCDFIFGPPVLKEEKCSAFVYCPTCGVETRRFPSTADAIAAWNQRANPQPAAVEGLVEAAKQYVADFEGDFCIEGVIVDDPDPLLKLHYISLRQALAQIERTEDV